MDDTFKPDKLKREVKHVQCFPAGTMVHTDKGLIPIQDVKVGDMVLSRPEWGGENAPTEYKRVVRAFCAGEAEVIRLVCQRKSEYAEFGTPIHVQFLTPNHPIWVDRLDEWIPACDLYIGEEISGISQDDPLIVLSIDPVYKASLSPTHHLGICREPSYGDEYRNDVDMYIDFDKNGYTVNYNRFTSDYVFDRDVYCGYDYDAKKIISDSFEEDPSRLLETLVYNIEVEEFHTYFIGKESILVHNASCIE